MQLYLMGVGTDNRILQTTQLANGYWPVFEDVTNQLTPTGPIVDIQVTHDDTTGNLHLCLVTDNFHALYATRTANDTWSRLEDITAQLGDDARLSSAGIVCVSGQMHIIGASLQSGVIMQHLHRTSAGTWEYVAPVTDPEGNTIALMDVTCVGDAETGDIHVCGETQMGEVYHTFRHSTDSVWSFFEALNLEHGGVTSGEFNGVACSVLNKNLYVCGKQQDGRLQYLIRQTDGHWSPFTDIPLGQPSHAIGAFATVACTTIDSNIHICGVSNQGEVWHSWLQTNSTWTIFENIARSGSASSPGGFSLISATGLKLPV